jgi:ABC-type uncharacterized transport system permease subunit
MYVRARGDLPDQDRGREFADREVKLATTIGGAGVLHGDLTAECAAAVVLDALAAPAGAEDDRTKAQRYHDPLAEAMRSLKKCIVILAISSWSEVTSLQALLALMAPATTPLPALWSTIR